MGLSRTIVLCSATVFMLFIHDCIHAADVYQTELTVGAGRRTDNFNWNIAGNIAGTDPNILSELTWTDIEIFQVDATLKQSFGPLHFIGTYNHGWIRDGRNRDSDYLGDDRTLEFSRSNNRADRGRVWDASIGTGYTKRVFHEETRYGTGSIDLTPMIGYSYHRQSLALTDGFQTVDALNDPPQLGPIPGLDSKYKARWHGPWVGIGIGVTINSLSISWASEFHRAVYRGDLFWNLRDDLAQPKNGEDRANGRGTVNSLGVAYALSERWSLSGKFDYQKWKTSAGTQTTFLADGSTVRTRLNEVNWKSESFTVGAKYAF